MRKVLTLLGLAACLTGTASAAIVWAVDSNSELYTVNTATAVATPVALLANSINTIAVANGILFGMSSTNDDLYKINGLGGETFVAATGKAGIVALAGDATGNVWAAAANTLWEFSSTGTLLGTFTGTFAPGDLEFIGNTLYMTQANVLDTVVASAGTATITRVNAANTLPGTTVGLANVPGTLFGFTATQVYTVNQALGTGAGATNVTGLVGGGAIVDAAGTPEPASFAIIGLGLLGLGGLAYRRKKT